jgi:hypothetical protein
MRARHSSSLTLLAQTPDTTQSALAMAHQTQEWFAMPAPTWIAQTSQRFQ